MDEEELEEEEEEEDDDEATEDIEQIAQFQHKILRKYAMLGFIRYSAIPFFHQLVHIRDYKMSCIFEVFAQNRNDEDFLENLKILDDIRTRQEEMHMQLVGEEHMNEHHVVEEDDHDLERAEEIEEVVEASISNKEQNSVDRQPLQVDSLLQNI